MKFKLKLMTWFFRVFLKTIAVFSTKKAASIAFKLFTTPIRKAKASYAQVFSEAEKITLEVDDVLLKGFLWKKDNPKKALIVHGFESRAYNFEKYVQPLIDSGHMVIAMDAKAHGNSEGKTIVLPEYMAMIKKLEDTYGKFDTYIGHSFGGLAISLFLEKYPNLNSKAVLIAPATETATAIKLFCKFLHLNDQVEKEIKNMIFQKSGIPVESFSVKKALQSIHSQILWIHDLNDDITPYEDTLFLKEANYKNVDFITTEQLGHRKIYRDPQVMQQIFAFITQSS